MRGLVVKSGEFTMISTMEDLMSAARVILGVFECDDC